MRRLVHLLVAGALGSTMVGATATPSSAERWWGRDAGGDVRQVGLDPEPPPCGTFIESAADRDTTMDIVGLSVRHEGPTVELRAHFADLTVRAGRQVSFDVETDGRDYEIEVIRWSGRRDYEASVAQAAEPPTTLDECGGYASIQMVTPCPDLTLTWDRGRDFVAVAVPRSCLRYPRWVKAGVRNSRTVGERYRYDVWAPRGADQAVHSGPFGPRVRHSR